MTASRPVHRATASARSRLVITGVVQGVGFRPFVYRLAVQLGLSGWVLNSTQGVVIEVEGDAEAVDRFVRSIPAEAPRQAKVERIEQSSLPSIGYSSFAIEPSQEPEGHFSLISTDLCICDDCLREMRDTANRRYRYPFINCTNCGPRFTIVKEIPYDRSKTTMACFSMCPECQAEYDNPADRRFHAQPNACSVCGPSVWLVRLGDEGRGRGGERARGRRSDRDEAIDQARRLLAGGSIVAVKGLGGFHLACDAASPNAVAELRRRKRRSDKPFAVMSLDAETVASYCYVSDEERQLLESPMRPIVLLRRREGSPISDLVAPGNSFLGVMLPYTPLHYLLLEKGSGSENPAGSGSRAEPLVPGVDPVVAPGHPSPVGAVREPPLPPADDLVPSESASGALVAAGFSLRVGAQASSGPGIDASAGQAAEASGPGIDASAGRAAGASGSPSPSPAKASIPGNEVDRRHLTRASAASRPAGELAPAHHSSPITHHFPVALVMTSGNMSEEPIATGNREALERLDSLADAWLLHNRDIELRCDDSVTRIFRGSESVIRRSRGYAPFPVRLGFEAQDLLACGGQLKNTFCITKGSYAFLSQHIGDLENAETLASFADSVEHFRQLFRLEIGAVAHDMHPEYLSTRYAWELAERADLPLVPVQHHHAHIASCMAENGVDEPVIGVAFDGTGYGDDGHIWGGEFLVCDFSRYRRAAHLKYLRLPGGEAAIHRPYRMAASYLVDALGLDALQGDLFSRCEADATELAVLRRQIEGRINSPLTSSAGRLFDAVSSLLGVRQLVSFEGQAAIELEMAAQHGVEESYPWEIDESDGVQVVDLTSTIRRVAEEVLKGTPTGIVSARFHNTVADLIAATCGILREKIGLDLVALSGGVFQNQLLLERTCRLLEARDFRVLTHHQVPANDGGIALGQAVIANRAIRC